MPPKLKAQEKHSGNECVFCYSSKDEEEAYGKKLKKAGITVHYFCMLFASGLWQRGKKDSDGILGFMPSDIKREQKCSVHVICHYCQKKGASIHCTVKSCQKVFHFRCGRDAGGLCQFYDQFRAYCADHRPHQSLDGFPKASESSKPSACCICMLKVCNKVSTDTLCAPCCGGSWFHRVCIQRYAVTAGLHFFKCPLCNNKPLFQDEMLKFGIYVPEQDAAWEREPNAFQELLERHSNCDAGTCLCPQGRQHKGFAGSPWELLLCGLCGSKGTHVECCGFIDTGKESVCLECAEIACTFEERQQKLMERSGATRSSPRVADSVEEIRQHLQDQRSCLLRARQASRRQGSGIRLWDHTPSTSRQREQSVDADQSAGSEDEASTPVTSPTLLEDRRLVSSTPVVRIERANSEIEVNILDSEEETADEDEDEPGCARLIELSRVRSAQRLVRQKSTAGLWDVQRKVEVLSVMKQQDGSSAGQGPTSAVPTQPSTQPSSKAGQEFSETTTAAGVIDKQSAATAAKVLDEQSGAVAASRPDEKVSLVQKCKSGNQDLASEDKQSGSRVEEKSEKSPSPFLITTAHKAAFQRLMPALRLPRTAEPPEVFQVLDSSSEQEDNSGVQSKSTSRQAQQSPAVQVSTMKEEEPAKSQCASASEMHVEFERALEQRSVYNLRKTSLKPRYCSTGTENGDKMNVSLLSKERTPDAETSNEVSSTPAKRKRGRPPKRTPDAETSNEVSSTPAKRKRGRPPKLKTLGLQQRAGPVQVPEDSVPSVEGTARGQWTRQSGTSDEWFEVDGSEAQSAVQQQNPGPRCGQRGEERTEDSLGHSDGSQAAAAVSVPDDVVAMHQSIPPGYAQFRIPKPTPGVEHTTVPSRPLLSPASVCVGAVPPVTAVRPDTAAPYWSLPGSTGMRLQIGGSVRPQTRPPAPVNAGSFCHSSPVLCNPRHAAGSQPQAGAAPSSQTAATTSVTTQSGGNAPGADEDCFISMPTSQPVQFRVLAVQPQGPVPVRQNTTSTARPCSGTASQSQPSSSVGTSSQFFPIVPQNGTPLIQWIPLSRCYSTAPLQRGSYVTPPAQAQGNSSTPQELVTVSAFRPPEHTWRYVSCAPSRSQFINPASQQVPPQQVVNGSSTQLSTADDSSSYRYPSNVPRHITSSNDSSFHHSVDQRSASRMSDCAVSANYSAYNQDHRSVEGQWVAGGMPPVSQSSALPVHPLPRNQHQLCQLGTGPELPHRASWHAAPVSQPSGNAPGLSVHSSAGVSDAVPDRSASAPRKETAVPAGLYAQSSATAAVASFSPLPIVPEAAGAVDSCPPRTPTSGADARAVLAHLLLNADILCQAPRSAECVSATEQASQQHSRRQDSSAPAPAPAQAVASCTRALAPTVPGQTPSTPAGQSVRPALSAGLQPGTVGLSPQKSGTGTSSSVSQQAGTPNQRAVTGHSQPDRQGVATWDTKQPAPVAASTPVPGHESQSTAGTAVSPPVVSSLDGDSLAISRGKIWLASEPMQAQQQKQEVVLLSDSDDSSDDLELTGVSLGDTPPGVPKHKHPGQCGHSQPQPGHQDGPVANSLRRSSPEITVILVPAPNKPPCPVHGLFRLVHHPQPSVPAQRNPDGSLSIDLTEDEPCPKKTCPGDVIVSDDDSDLEIIS